MPPYVAICLARSGVSPLHLSRLDQPDTAGPPCQRYTWSGEMTLVIACASVVPT